VVDSLYPKIKHNAWIIPSLPCERKLYDYDTDYDFYETLQQIQIENKQLAKVTRATESDTIYDIRDRISCKYQSPIEPQDGIAIEEDVDAFMVQHGDQTTTTGVRPSTLPKKEQKQPFELTTRNFVSQRFLSAISVPRGKPTHFKTISEAEQVGVPQAVCILPYTYFLAAPKPPLSLLSKTKYSRPFIFDISMSQNEEYEVTDTHRNLFPSKNMKRVLFPLSMEQNLYTKENYRDRLIHTFPTVDKMLQESHRIHSPVYSLQPFIANASYFGITHEHFSHSLSLPAKKQIDQNVQNLFRMFKSKKQTSILFSKETEMFVNTPVGLEGAYGGGTSSEQLRTMIQEDNLSLFSYHILLTAFANLLNVEDYLETYMSFPMTSPLFTNPHQKRLTKKYKSWNELTRDNGHEIEIDKEFDLDYEAILKPYKQALKSKNDREQLNWLAETLSSQFGCLFTKATELATVLLQKHQKVKEGDYARVQFEQSRFYKRIENQWIFDKDVDDDTRFMKSWFCNIDWKKRDAVAEWTPAYSKEKNRPYWIHNSTQKTSWNPPVQLQNIMPNLAEIVNIDLAAIKKNIEEEIKKGKSQLNLSLTNRKLILSDVLQCKWNARSHDVLRSPHSHILAQIMHPSLDFATKQNKLIEFYARYCREPVGVEAIYWKYCRETNTKLMSASLYDLAIAYVGGNGNYMKKFYEICSAKGVKSDDGYCIVDKFCGNTLRVCAFVSEAFQREDVEEEAEYDFEYDFDVEPEPEPEPEPEEEAEEPKETRFDTSRNDNIVYPLMNELCFYLDIPTTAIERPVMTYMKIFEGKNKTSAKKFKLAKEKLADKNDPGKLDRLYAKYEEDWFYSCTISFVILAVQTHIPTLIPKKTMYGCRFSFRGYPLEDDKNMATMDYFDCVLKSIHPDRWNVAKPAVLRVLEFVKKDPFWHTLIVLKHEDLKHTPDEIPSSVGLRNRWPQYQPYLQKITGKSNVTASVDTTTEFMFSLKSGSTKQWDYFSMYAAKCQLLTFQIFEEINSEVHAQIPILNMFVNKTPYLMNACCSDESILIPYEYFKKRKSLIGPCHAKIFAIEKILNTIQDLTKAAVLHCPILSASSLIQSIEISYKESFAYRSFIAYSNIESSYFPYPRYLNSLLGTKDIRELKKNYPAYGSLEEKIAYLKSEEMSFSAEKSRHMYQLVNAKNEIKHRLLSPNRNSLVWEDFSASSASIKSFWEPFQPVWRFFEADEEAKQEWLRELKKVQPPIPIEPWVCENEFCKKILYLLCVYYPLCISNRQMKFIFFSNLNWGILPNDVLKIYASLAKHDMWMNDNLLLHPFLKKLTEDRHLLCFYHLVAQFPKIQCPEWNSFCISYVCKYYLYKASTVDQVTTYLPVTNFVQPVTEFLKKAFERLSKTEERRLHYSDIVKDFDKEVNIEKERVKAHFAGIEDKNERQLEKQLKIYKLGPFAINLKTMQTYGKKRNEMFTNQLQQRALNPDA